MIIKKVAVFGSGGLLGSDLVRVGSEKYQILSYHREVDITNRDVLWNRIKNDKPDWVINSAGQSNVDASEKDPEGAFALNCQGPKNLAEICSDLNIPLIHFSTDYVFPGSHDHIYLETDTPDPINEYGKSKLAGEREVSQWERHYILRVSSLFGWARENHATRVLAAIKSGQKIKIATDMVCSPTYTVSVAEMTYKLINNKSPFGIYHAVSAGTCSRYEFAQALCHKMKVCPDDFLEPIRINSLMLPAKRPECLRLSNSKLANAYAISSSWRANINMFLNVIMKNDIFA